MAVRELEQTARHIYTSMQAVHHTKAEAQDVVNGIIVEDVEDVMEDDEGDVQVPKDQLMPCGSCLSQQGLHLN